MVHRDITRFCTARRSLRNSPRCNRTSSSCWPNFGPASMTPLRLTSTGRVGNTAQIVITPERAASRPSGASSRPFGLPRAWASKATIANGSICCELAIEDPYGRSGRTALLWRNRASRVRQIHGADRATSPASRLRRPSPCLRFRFRPLLARSDATIFVRF